MPLILKSVFLRWYRSFNTLSEPKPTAIQPWERIGDQDFQFVEIDVDRRITAVAGANESGKSHLLNAIAQAIKTGAKTFTASDICRHCAFNVLDQEAVPSIGVRLVSSRPSDTTPVNGLLEALSIPTRSSSEIVVILRPDPQAFATIYGDGTSPLGVASREAWYAATEEFLPEVEFIQPNKKFGSHIHISQLISAYGDAEALRFFDTIPLNEIGRDILNTRVPPAPSGEELIEYPTAFANAIAKAKQQLNDHILGVDDTALLARDLFEHILDIPKEKLTAIQQMGRNERGYVELFVADLNERIEQRLDLSSYWSQDEEITLAVNYKDGFFYFEIRDKTHRTFTFEERSSGLRYFLSYYIQSLAIKRRGDHRKQGSIVLMDEPDRFL